MKEQYHIGCSGYYYPSWKNKFYPEGMQPKNWLAYYSTVFNTVELNGTFYRTPKLKDLQKYSTETSKDFTFSVKMSRYITHIQKLKDSGDLVSEFQELIKKGLEKKLAYFLFQMPPSFHYTEENMALVIAGVPHKSNNVIEFRHISWWSEEVKTELKKAKITFCNVDFPGISSNFIHTTDRFYLRLHGNPELFKSSYSLTQLKKFYKMFPAGQKSYTVYFNNTFYEAGYTNAKQFQQIIKK
jgi:uncharacterized protein YecE (DUF72 family)